MKSNALIYGGLLLIAAALFLVGYNMLDAYRAEKSAEQIVRGLEMQVSDESLESSDEEASVQSDLQTQEAILDFTRKMPIIDLNSNQYIGILEIPSLELVLPVMSDLSDSKLKLAPCRYGGSAYSNDLVIAAHNYSTHFGALESLGVGAVVIFTDVESHVFSYAVSKVERIPATGVGELQSGEWDLTLFTCTIGGKARIVARCELLSIS